MVNCMYGTIYSDTNQVLEMDRLISEGLKDIPSDEEVSDTEDPDLLVLHV